MLLSRCSDFVLDLINIWAKLYLLTRQNQLFLVLNLVLIIVTRGACDSHHIFVNIKNEIMLTHQRPTNDQIRATRNVDADTVLIISFSVKIFTWIPF